MHWPPEQTKYAAQPPQYSVPPQPSLMFPHEAPADAHVCGMHGHAGPQLTVPPQPSLAVPHVLLPQACAADNGEQQVCDDVQTCPSWQPQLIVPPQPSENEPHAPAGHVCGLQV